MFCGHCGTSNAAGARFCHSCGAPLPGAAAGVAAPYAYAAPPLVASVARGKGRGVWVGFLGGLAVVVVAVFGLALVLRPGAAGSGSCPPVCRPAPPPKAPPLGEQHVYTSTKYGYSVSYSDTTEMLGAVLDHSDDSTLALTWQGFPIVVTAEPSGGRSAQQVASDVAGRIAPGASQVYALPAAELGYNPGYGAVYDAVARSGAGQSQHVRVVIEVAVKRGLAVEFYEIGPFKQTVPADSFPNPADTRIVFRGAQLANTVVFPGDSGI